MDNEAKEKALAQYHWATYNDPEGRASKAGFIAGFDAGAAHERERLEAVLRPCIEAIATLDPRVFGVGSTDDGTHWYIRDELIGRAKAALGEANDGQG